MGPLSLEPCLASGGVFSLIIPPVALVLLAFEIVWLFRVVIRELKQRTDLTRIRDLIIEGSLGQAILHSDKRSKDDVVGVCRAGLVAIQSSGDWDTANEKIVREATLRFGGQRGTWVRIFFLLAIAFIPIGLAGAGLYYAHDVVSSELSEVSAEERAALVSASHSEPAFTCPTELGGLSLVLLAVPALAIAALQFFRRSARTRDRSVTSALQFAEMALRVVNPAHRVYKDEREREGRRRASGGS